LVGVSRVGTGPAFGVRRTYEGTGERAYDMHHMRFMARSIAGGSDGPSTDAVANLVDPVIERR